MNLPERNAELKKLAETIKKRAEALGLKPGTEKYKRLQEDFCIGFYTYRNFIIVTNAEVDSLVIDPLIYFSVIRGNNVVSEVEKFLEGKE